MTEPERADNSTLSLLRDQPDFRRYWAALGLSNMGDWIQTVAGGWLITRLTDSATVIGAVTSAVTVPIMGLMLMGGVLADRHDRRKIMLTTQSLLCLVTLGGAAVVAMDQVSLPLVCLWFLLIGALVAFNAPSEQALLAQLVPPHQLQTAVGLFAASFSASQLVGTAFAATLLGVGALHWLFLANGLSFFPLIIVLLTVRPRARVPMPVRSVEQGTLREGLRYAWGHRHLRALLMANALVTVCVYPFCKVFLPIYVKTILRGSEFELGHIMFGMGAGAFLGSLLISRVARRVYGVTLIVTYGCVSLSLVGLSFATTLGMALASTVLLGFSISLAYGLTQTLLQVASEDRLRGRVLSFSELMQLGAPPLAALAMGALVDGLQFPSALRVAAFVFLIPTTAWLASALLPEALPDKQEN